MDVPQVVARDVLTQRVERQVAHRQLLARRPVEVVGESAGEDGQVGHPRGHEQLERPTELVTATHQTDRIGLLVGHGSDGVHSTRHLGKLRPPPRAARRAGGTAGAVPRCGCPRAPRRAGTASATAPASTSSTATGGEAPTAVRCCVSTSFSRDRAGQHLPRQRHQQQPERDSGQQRELLPVQPHGKDRRDDPRGQDTSAERREQPERAREPRGSQRGEPSCGSAPVPAGWFTRGREGRAPARAGRR